MSGLRNYYDSEYISKANRERKITGKLKPINLCGGIVDEDYKSFGFNEAIAEMKKRLK